MADHHEARAQDLALVMVTDAYLSGVETLIPVRELLPSYAPRSTAPDLVAKIGRDLLLDLASVDDLLDYARSLTESAASIVIDWPATVTHHRHVAPTVDAVDALLGHLDRRGLSGSNTDIHQVGRVIAHLFDLNELGFPFTRTDPGDGPGLASRLLGTFSVVYALLAVVHVDRRMANTDPEAPDPRVASVTHEQALQTRAAFEVPLRQLADAAQDWLNDDEAAFVTSTLRSIHEWAQRGGDANPQIFELLIADLVRKLFDRYTDTDRLRTTFEQLGAEPFLAAHVANSIVDRVRDIQALGDDDPDADGERLDRIAGTANEIDRLGRHLAQGAATEAGRLGTRGLVAVVRNNWDQIQIGLILALRAAKDWFT